MLPFIMYIELEHYFACNLNTVILNQMLLVAIRIFM